LNAEHRVRRDDLADAVVTALLSGQMSLRDSEEFMRA
jgi:hypothetical protein